MAAKPEANINQVPGSGTVAGPLTPQGPTFFFLPPLPPSPVVPMPFFFFSGPQRPTGRGGGAMGTKLPPTNGLYKLSGPAGSKVAVSGRLSNADGNATGGA